ncbi:MAG: SNF2 helicase associated domain-containing protein, partial [Lentisphaeraceae bacterium]|nr:SNF2 helicase associated domain-containing protein [Lentisphaeraceae bacterium]
STHGLIHRDCWYPVDFSAYKYFIDGFAESKGLIINEEQLNELQEKILCSPSAPQLIIPEKRRLPLYHPPLKKTILFEESSKIYKRKPQCRVSMRFQYDDQTFELNDQRHGARTDKGFLFRDIKAEASAVEEIKDCHIRMEADELLIPNNSIYSNLQKLSAAGWEVKVKGNPVRSQTGSRLKVKSGIDWLEVNGVVEFGEEKVSLRHMLDRLKENHNTVVLSDGSLGYFREEDFKKLQALLKLGKKGKDGYTFHKSQTFILDALLAEQPGVDFDEAFQQARQKLSDFSGIGKMNPPKSFKGKLRDYQKEGLAWLHFTREFGIGACLADDMGLGKTVQVIALLEHRRLDNKINSPSLIVVPTSLIFNWQNEFDKFSPEMDVYVHTGTERTKDIAVLNKHDIVLTTYGVMRNDITMLKDINFDYAILDEGQAIKNAVTASAKASRVLNADHRLIMSGTPIENHLGELWSLFEFLNPGMLGTATAFKRFNMSIDDQATLEVFSKALRPMILRRKKEDVAKDLPAKTEQTLYCQMEGAQLAYYNKLRDAYRQELLNMGEGQLKKNQFKILEALLRLRQAASHPGMIDAERIKDGSAKLDMVIPQIAEVIDEGHKVLVFSQFTKFLSLVRIEFDKLNIPYEYLDGRTRNRQQKVENFQNDPDCKLFLISLKAGGTGLNLTEAEYVYILDPWWNPAVEAQAIDRAHRIGQQRHVFAYKVIAKDSIEEKILQLQAKKKNVADAILSGDNKSLRNLTQEDLEILFS